MRPIVNVPEEDRATDIANMHKKLVKITHGFRRHPVGQTDRQTHLSQFTILHNRSCGEVITNCITLVLLLQCSMRNVLVYHETITFFLAPVKILAVWYKNVERV